MELKKKRHVYLFFSDIIVFTKPQKKWNELWKETKQIVDIENVVPVDVGQVSSMRVQLKGGSEINVKFNGPGIRNLWMTDIKGAIMTISQGQENKVNQNFIFTHKTEPVEKQTKSKRKLSFRKSFIKEKDGKVKDKKDPTEDSLEISKLDPEKVDPNMTPEQKLKYLEDQVIKLKKNVKQLRISNKKYDKREKEFKESIEQLKPFFEKIKEYSMPRSSTKKNHRKERRKQRKK